MVSPMEVDKPKTSAPGQKSEENGKSKATAPAKDEKEKTPKDPDSLTLEDIREQIRYIEKFVSTKEPHFMSRVVRSLLHVRRKLNNKLLHRLIQGYYPNPSDKKTLYLSYLPELMDTNESATPASPFRPRSSKATTPLLPEVEVYIHLLLFMYLIDSKRSDDNTLKCAHSLMEQICGYNRRSLDMLSANAYFCFSRAYELCNKLDDIRPFLQSRLRTSALRNDINVQAVLINLLLRNYLKYQLYEQADLLTTKMNFPENASTNEWARYLYYSGKIKAIQLEYSSAHEKLTSALRKAPQNTAIGFKQATHKLNIVVQLLLGDMPDRSTFRQPTLKTALSPYFQLTQAVHTGNLDRFKHVLHEFGSKFQADETYSLIVRLRHNVIKTGVRQISQSYSRISLANIALKLQLGSPEDAEFIVAKAIRDGVIEATINHEEGYVKTKEISDIYSTAEPLNQFNNRIRFCLDIRNQSVRAMRYPAKSYNLTENAEERREREQQELESAKEFSDEDYEDFS